VLVAAGEPVDFFVGAGVLGELVAATALAVLVGAAELAVATADAVGSAPAFVGETSGAAVEALGATAVGGASRTGVAPSSFDGSAFMA
jgi:hypothetical protein